MSSAALASSWPCSSKLAGELAEIGEHLAGDLAEAADVRSPCGRSLRRWRAVTSFMALTNSDTRSISVFSSALMFSCEPVSTSCSMTLASRSRPNRAVVSERSMLCVCMQLVDGRRRGFLRVRRSPAARRFLQAGEGAVDRLRRGLAGGVDEAGDLLGVLGDGAAEAVAPLLDHRHRLFGRLGDLVAELQALVADGGEQAAALVGQDRLDFVRAAGDFAGDALGLADEAARRLPR